MDTPAEEDVVNWWDKMAENEREDVDYLVIGREGERLTMEYETTRTGKKPLWQSIETNLAGYDIISRNDKNDDAGEILIEVKASKQPVQNAYLIITRHEWEVANYSNNANRYYFYLWLLGESKMLARITSYDIASHIPKETGEGTWEEVKIPFKTFESEFKKVNS